jgi:hypothetical protein
MYPTLASVKWRRCIELPIQTEVHDQWKEIRRTHVRRGSPPNGEQLLRRSSLPVVVQVPAHGPSLSFGLREQILFNAGFCGIWGAKFDSTNELRLFISFMMKAHDTKVWIKLAQLIFQKLQLA